jgi:hypothetical protein
MAGTMDLGVWCKPHHGPKELKVFVDSDWAGCKKTRKSTTGFCVFLDNVLLTSASKTQSVIAQSSGEAKFYAIYQGAVEALFVQRTLAEVGITVPITIYSDSSAGRAIAQRQGVGRVKHLAVKALYVQDLVQAKAINIMRVKSEENPADLMTKPVSASTLARLLGVVNVYPVPRELIEDDVNEASGLGQDDKDAMDMLGHGQKYDMQEAKGLGLYNRRERRNLARRLGVFTALTCFTPAGGQIDVMATCTSPGVRDNIMTAFCSLSDINFTGFDFKGFMLHILMVIFFYEFFKWICRACMWCLRTGFATKGRGGPRPV